MQNLRLYSSSPQSNRWCHSGFKFHFYLFFTRMFFITLFCFQQYSRVKPYIQVLSTLRIIFTLNNIRWKCFLEGYFWQSVKTQIEGLLTWMFSRSAFDRLSTPWKAFHLSPLEKCGKLFSTNFIRQNVCIVVQFTGKDQSFFTIFASAFNTPP